MLAIQWFLVHVYVNSDNVLYPKPSPHMPTSQATNSYSDTVLINTKLKPTSLRHLLLECVRSKAKLGLPYMWFVVPYLLMSFNTNIACVSVNSICPTVYHGVLILVIVSLTFLTCTSLYIHIGVLLYLCLKSWF